MIALVNVCAADGDVHGCHVNLQTMKRRSAAPPTSFHFSNKKLSTERTQLTVEEE